MSITIPMLNVEESWVRAGTYLSDKMHQERRAGQMSSFITQEEWIAALKDEFRMEYRYIDNGVLSVIFETEEDYTFFVLKWS